MTNGETFDLVDENRKPLGLTWRRCVAPLPDGAFHVVAAIWTVNDSGELLITKRAPNKDWPNMWENTAGSVVAGETSEQAAFRELFEETGIKPGKLRFFAAAKEKNAFIDMYFARVSGRPEVTLQEGETADFRWVDAETFERLRESGEVCEPVAERYAAFRGVIRGEALSAKAGSLIPPERRGEYNQAEGADYDFIHSGSVERREF